MFTDDPRQPLRYAWREQGACFNTDSSAFIPSSIALEDTRVLVSYQTALRVCSKCPVITDCLEYAMTTRQSFGVWGGMTPRQRQTLRKARSRKRAS